MVRHNRKGFCQKGEQDAMNEEKKKNYCWRFWPFTQCNFARIPAYLEQMERKGLRLCEITEIPVLAKYEKVKPADTTYQVGLLESKKYEDILHT